MTDRWRITPPPYELTEKPKGRPIPRRVKEILGQEGATLDPYNTNLLKGDLPIFGKDWFLNLTAISDTLAESRTLPTPSGVSAVKPHLDHRLRQRQPEPLQRKPHRVIRSFSGTDRIQADRTAIQSHADRATSITSICARTVWSSRTSAEERRGRMATSRCRSSSTSGRSADLSPNYDFISFRAGSQPFNSDFRGFIFNDTNLGVPSLRQLRVQSLPIQPGSVRPAGKRHQLRPQHEGSARSEGRHRQRLLAGLPRPRIHAAVQLPLRARRGHLPLRPQRRPRASRAGRRFHAA